MKRRLLLGLMLVAPWIRAVAADYPNRPIRMIVPFVPGSTSDGTARMIAQQLTELLKQSVYVENHPGADGRIGLMVAKVAPADGYTLVLATWSNLSVNPVVIKDLPYDAGKDFMPVAGATRSMLAIAVPANSRFKTLADLVAAAKIKPGQVNFGTFASGYLLATDWFSSLAGIKFTDVPYKSTTQMDVDLAGGQIDAAMDGVASLEPQLKSGQLRALAVTGDKRHPKFPAVPTVAESGYPQYSIYGWAALCVRNGTPASVTDVLVNAMAEVLKSAVTHRYALAVGSEIMARSPAEMKTFLDNETATFRRVAADAGLQPQ